MVFTEEKLAKPTVPFIAKQAAFFHTLHLVNVNFEFGFFAAVLRTPITLHGFVVSILMFPTFIGNIFDIANLGIFRLKEHYI